MRMIMKYKNGKINLKNMKKTYKKFGYFVKYIAVNLEIGLKYIVLLLEIFPKCKIVNNLQERWYSIPSSDFWEVINLSLCYKHVSESMFMDDRKVFVCRFCNEKTFLKPLYKDYLEKEEKFVCITGNNTQTLTSFNEDGVKVIENVFHSCLSCKNYICWKCVKIYSYVLRAGSFQTYDL